MARVYIEKLREQESHFGLYKTSAGGDEAIIVRRKVGEPTDYMHPTSRTLRRQRENFALASQHYAHLTSTQKANTRHQFEEVEFQQSHGKTDIKLLTGRQLFIAKELRSLNVTQKKLSLPLEICIVLTDQDLNPLEGQLWLRYLTSEGWLDCDREMLTQYDWLFPRVPVGKPSYHPYGEAPGYFDPQDPATTYLSENQLRLYHYHRLIPSVPEYTAFWEYVGIYAAQGFIANKNAGTVDIMSWVTTHDFIGDLTIGIKEYVGSWPPPEWIASQTYPITYGMPDPKHYRTILSGLNLLNGTMYWLEYRLSVSPPTAMSGESNWWLIP